MAEHATLELIISNIDGPLYRGKVASVTLPGADGEMTLLANHEALISPLKEGTITVRKADGEETFPIENGMLEVSNNQATVLL